MLDRVREALFSILGADHGGLADALVLDLYAGSGSLGLEALSRGAARARLVERGAAALQVLRANIEALDLGARAEVLCGDALAESSWVPLGAPEPREPPPFDVIFFDPPYPLLSERRTRVQLLHAAEQLVREHLAPDGSFVFHAPKDELARSELSAAIDVEERVYGSTSLWLLRPEA